MIGGTREAIQTALAYAYLGNTITAEFVRYLCPIDRSPANPATMMAYAVQMAKIRAAISEQPSSIRNWLYICYGPDVESLQKGNKRHKLAHTILSNGHYGPMGTKRKGRLEKMALLAIEDARMGILMTREMPKTIYCDELGVNDHNWARDWEPYRRTMLIKLRDMDSDGIGRVSVVVRAIREAEAEA
jgi:hypothetical protein